MRGCVSLLVSLVPFLLSAQQGFLPLSRTVDAPYTAMMHGSRVAVHSAIHPYLREDLASLPAADTLLAKAALPWLDRMTDPAKRFHGGPLIDAMAGASLGGTDPLKYRTGVGGWLEWNASSHWTLETDIEGWAETLPNYLDSMARVTGVTPGEGYAYRDGPNITHFDWNGYADYKAGKYFHFTLGKGKHFIGDGYRSLFLSDEAYSYPYFKITTTAWHIRYVNLFTLMDDIRGAGGDPARYAKKLTSMHYLSWNVSRRVNAGLFEAIVWQDDDPDYPRGFDLAYINPVIFYRPVEYGLGSPDNALLGLALNVKVGKRAEIYSQLILDEFLLEHVRAGDGWYGNKQGLQLGVVAHDAFHKRGLMLRGEVDYIRPFLYTHSDTRQNYAHHGQPLAHPYGSGFVEWLAEGEWRRGRWLLSDVLSCALMGQDTSLASYGNDIFQPEGDRPLSAGAHSKDFGYYLGRPSQVLLVQNELRVGWMLEPRSGLMLEAAWTFRSEDPEIGASLMTNYFRIGLSANLWERHPFQAVRQ
jgi:hypothetical protein